MNALRSDGRTFGQISKILNSEGGKTRCDGKWFPGTVRRILLKNS
jgi:Recombinase